MDEVSVQTAPLIIYAWYKLACFTLILGFQCPAHTTGLNTSLLDSDPKTDLCHKDIDPLTTIAIIVLSKFHTLKENKSYCNSIFNRLCVFSYFPKR